MAAPVAVHQQQLDTSSAQPSSLFSSAFNNEHQQHHNQNQQHHHSHHHHHQIQVNQHQIYQQSMQQHLYNNHQHHQSTIEQLSSGQQSSGLYYHQQEYHQQAMYADNYLSTGHYQAASANQQHQSSAYDAFHASGSAGSQQASGYHSSYADYFAQTSGYNSSSSGFQHQGRSMLDNNQHSGRFQQQVDANNKEEKITQLKIDEDESDLKSNREALTNQERSVLTELGAKLTGCRGRASTEGEGEENEEKPHLNEVNCERRRKLIKRTSSEDQQTLSDTNNTLPVFNQANNYYQSPAQAAPFQHKQTHSPLSPLLNSTSTNQEHNGPKTEITGCNINPESASSTNNATFEHSSLRILEMRKEKSRDAARSRRSKENHEFYELAKLLPLPAAITSQLDFLDKASIIRLTISFLKLRQFSVNGSPAWAPDFTTLGSVNPYSSQSLSSYAATAEQYTTNNNQQQDSSRPASTCHKQQDDLHTSAYSSTPAAAAVYYPIAQHPADLPVAKNLTHAPATTTNLFDLHQGTHILQSLDGFAFAIGRDGKFLYISETVSMYLGLSQVEMTGSSVFDYTHQQDHEELAKQLGIAFSVDANPTSTCNQDLLNSIESPPQPASVRSQYSAASNETSIDDYMQQTNTCAPLSSVKRQKATTATGAPRGAYGGSSQARLPANKRQKAAEESKIKLDLSNSVMNESTISKLNENISETSHSLPATLASGTDEDPLVRQFCIRMKSTLTKRGCQHFKSSGYRVVHVVAHLRSYQSNDHGHLMDPLDDLPTSCGALPATCQAPASTSSKLSAGKRKQRSQENSSKTNKFTPSSSASSSSNSTTIKESSHEVTNNCDITEQRLPVREETTLQQLQKPKKIIGLVAVAIALPPPSINELRLESDTFVLRLGLDLRITHIEPKITDLLHYPIEYVAGRSLYSFIHPADVHQVQRCHRDLLKKGQMMSGYYRLLARSGGYIWIQTCATLICNNTLSGHSNSTLPSSPSLSTITTASGGQAQANSDYNQRLHAGSSTNSNHHHQQRTTSPASHLSSSTNYGSDQLMFDQDQCVIFVNYMITNVVESDQILDICQSANYAPPPLLSLSSGGQFSGSTTATLFNSPSSCSSPSICLSNNNNNNNLQTQKVSQSSTSGYPSPPTRPTSRRTEPISNQSIHKIDNNHQGKRGDTLKLSHNGVSSSASSRSRINQAQGKALHNINTSDHLNKSKSIYLPNNTGEQQLNGHYGGTYNMEQAYELPQIQHDTLNPLYATYQQNSTGSGGITPLSAAALTASSVQNANKDANNWLRNQTHQHHHATIDNANAYTQQSTQQVASNATSSSSSLSTSSAGCGQQVVATGSDHYSLMNRSIYKAAAFCLDSAAAAGYTSSAAGSGAGHQQVASPASAVVYPQTAAAAAVASYAAAAAVASTATPVGVGNTWDAVNHHLSSHHHQPSNPYAPQVNQANHHHPSYYYGYYM